MTTTVTRKVQSYLVWKWDWPSLRVAYDESALHAISRKIAPDQSTGSYGSLVS